MSMTPRQRWLALLNGEKPDRIPTDYWAVDEVTERLLKDLRCADRDELYDKLHIDGVDRIDARPSKHHFSNEPAVNMWGVRNKVVQYEGGTYLEPDTHPLKDITTVEQVNQYPWPNPDDCDWEAFSNAVAGLSGFRAVRCGGYEPFLIYCTMRGMEQAMMDLLIEPDIADAIFTHLFDYHYSVNSRMFELADGKVDLTYVAEDLGSQSSLLIGLDQIRRFILPNQKRMADLARSHGIHVFYHTDGAARDVINDLIEVTGIEVLNPVQWRCPGMEREGLVRDFGGRIAFHGAMDNQQTMPFGTVEDVRREVLDNIRIFAPARWFCAPCHNLQAVTPTRNIVTMYETIWENGD